MIFTIVTFFWGGGSIIFLIIVMGSDSCTRSVLCIKPQIRCGGKISLKVVSSKMEDQTGLLTFQIGTRETLT